MDAKKEIIEYINNNLGERLTLEGLCEHFHTNRTTLARLIKEATGKSPIRYILEERLRRSRAELEEGELSVSEIAEKYGFSDDNYFIRAFKNKYGISPLQFRKSLANSTHNNELKSELQKLESFKNLIETAKSDMASHPAFFPQERIRYTAFAAETEKGNIYHTILDCYVDNEDEVIEQMKQNDDTRIIRFICMSGENEYYLGSHKLREKLRRLHPENGNTVQLYTDPGGYRCNELKGSNPLYFMIEDIDIFEFHDAEYEFAGYTMNSNDLHLFVKHLNVHKNTEQNPSDYDMEIKKACVTFYNFRMVYLRTKMRYQTNEKGEGVLVEGPEITLFGDGALQYFFYISKEKRVLTVLDLEKTENGEYIMLVSTTPGEFDIKFTISRVGVTWDEYEGKALYEQSCKAMKSNNKKGQI